MSLDEKSSLNLIQKERENTDRKRRVLFFSNKIIFEQIKTYNFTLQNKWLKFYSITFDIVIRDLKTWKDLKKQVFDNFHTYPSLEAQTLYTVKDAAVYQRWFHDHPRERTSSW